MRVEPGIEGSEWHAVDPAVIMPEPELTALTGGHRRIPAICTAGGSGDFTDRVRPAPREAATSTATRTLEIEARGTLTTSRFVQNPVGETPTPSDKAVSDTDRIIEPVPEPDALPSSMAAGVPSSSPGRLGAADRLDTGRSCGLPGSPTSAG